MTSKIRDYWFTNLLSDGNIEDNSPFGTPQQSTGNIILVIPVTE
jgi:hypothetical protein